MGYGHGPLSWIPSRQVRERLATWKHTGMSSTGHLHRGPGVRRASLGRSPHAGRRSSNGRMGTRSAAVECPAVVSLTRGPNTCRPNCQWPNCSGSLSGRMAHGCLLRFFYFYIFYFCFLQKYKYTPAARQSR